MKRKSDVQELLNEVKSILEQVTQIYGDARNEEHIVKIAKPKVKSCLEHLRSSLDYIAHDLSEKTNSTKTPRIIYFPYGKNQKNFNDSVKKNLPDLDKKYVDILKTIQPFFCGDDWLINLCHLNNFNKHVELKEQQRINSGESVTRIGNLICMDSTSTVIFEENATINGMLVSKKGRLVITSDKPISEISDELAIPFDINREYKWVKFLIKDTNIDILLLFEKSYKEINKLVDLIYTS
jgi:hypothetical protein